MTIGSTEDAWASIPLSSAGNGYIMTSDSRYICYDRDINLSLYSAIPDDEDMPVQFPVQPDISETCVRVEDVIALAQRFNGPEAALFVAAAQDFLDWVKTL